MLTLWKAFLQTCWLFACINSCKPTAALRGKRNNYFHCTDEKKKNWYKRNSSNLLRVTQVGKGRVNNSYCHLPLEPVSLTTALFPLPMDRLRQSSFSSPKSSYIFYYILDCVMYPMILWRIMLDFYPPWIFIIANK